MSERETSAEPKPFSTIEWNGSTAEIYDPSVLLEQEVGSQICIYDRADFQTPIERVQVNVGKVDIDGEPCTSLVATIRLDRSRDDYEKGAPPFGEKGLLSHFTGIVNTITTERGAFIPYSGKEQDLTIEQTVFGSVIRISHQSGVKVLVWVDSKNKLITISNNLSLHSPQEGDERQVTVTPAPDGTIDYKDMFEGFFKAFMRTMDHTSGLPDYTPAQHRLRRIYPIGKERRILSAQPYTPDIGRTALAPPENGSQNEVKDTLPQELGLDVIESGLTLDDIGGLESVKQMLRDIAVSFAHPEVMEKWGAKRPQGVLMYGEPGTGKTMLANALANEIGADMWALQSSDIYEKWLGNSETHIKDIFKRAKSHKGRLILFFDEFDSIVGITESPSPSGADNARNAVAGIFKQEMNTLAQENPNVLVIAATNNLDRIDPALIRSGRFDHKVYVPMPDQQGRQQIIANVVAKSILGQESVDFRVYADDLNVVELSSRTDGMSGADITEIFRRLSITRAMQEARTGEQPGPISQSEIEREIDNFKRNG